jgi:hypothetical protein
LLRHASVLLVAGALLVMVTRQDAPAAAAPLSVRGISAIQIDAVVERPSAAAMLVTRPAKTVVVRAGQTVEQLASRYGADAAAVRWANGLAAHQQPGAGVTLLLPPGKGALVRVHPGERPTDFAARLGLDPAVVLDYNSLRANQPLPAGSYLQVPLQSAPAGALISSMFTVGDGFVPRVADSRGSDTFPYGQCTWYVASRRNVTWGGNAWVWWYAAAGIRPEGRVPVAGAIVVFRSGWDGHVAYVEHVNADGTFLVSEMNYYADGGGWGRIDHRTVSPSDWSVMGFIY